jgi:choline-sulfatase
VTREASGGEGERTFLKRAADRIGRLSAPSIPAWLLVGSLALAACSEARLPPPPTATPTQIYLADFLEVGRIEGRVDRAAPDGDDAAPGIRQQLGSRMTYSFALPTGAVLSGTGSLRMDAGSAARVRVDVVDEGGDRRTILDERVGAGRPRALRLRTDLSANSARMVQLDFSFRPAEGSSGGGEIEWQQLRIDAARSEPPAWNASLRDRYNVLLIVMDSLRADHTAPYGDRDAHTPWLARLAKQGVTFDNARSSSSWTRPSIATLFTSLQPSSHGVLTFADGLADSLPYLPEILQQSGYRTLAVVNNAMVASDFGFARGFDRMSQLYPMDSEEALAARRDPESLAGFVWSRYIAAWLRDAASRPFFIYLHEVDPHSPYEPPEPYASLHDFGYDGDAQSTLMGLRALRQEPDSFDARDIRHLRSQYRGEIAFMDRYLGWVVDRLEALDLARSTLVIVASDHGEEFWDHRSVGHGHSVYEELLRVPLVMRLEGVLPAGRRVQTDVGLVDLAPTLLDLLGLEAPARMRGESLLPYIAAADDYRPLRASFARANRSWESLSYGRWKLILDRSQDDLQPALFDLEEDPREQHDRAHERPVIVGALTQMLREQQRENARRAKVEASRIAPTELEPEVLENLRALGYLE